MELRHFRYLVAVSEEGTFVGAAEKLRLAQPALSRQIRSLEKELGTPVFERSRSGVSLTPAGAICMGAARTILAKVDHSLEQVRLADAGRVGTCSIYASIWAVLSGFVARLVAYMAATEPGIRMIIEESGPGGHWGSIRAGTVDIAISTKPPSAMDDILSEPLIDDVVDTALLSKTHHLANRRSIRLTDLQNEPFLIYGSELVNFEDHDLEAVFGRIGFMPTTKRTIDSAEALIAMVANGMGWSIHRRTLRGKIPGVAMVPIEAFDFPFPVALVWRKIEVRPLVFTVMRRIREVAAIDHPELYHPSQVVEAGHDADDVHRVPVHGLEMRDLRYFAAVVEDLSIGRAAERLGISQPALSRQIQHLERDLGVTLINRSSRGIAPTPAGNTLYAQATEIIEQVDRLPSEVARGERAVAGECMVAAVPSPEVRELLTRAISNASATFPGIDFKIENVATPLQPQAIRDGAFDVGICFPYPGLVAGYPDIDCRELMQDRIDCALLPVGHPLAKREEIELKDLTNVPFLFFRRDFHPAFHDYLMEAFRSHGYRPLEGPMQEGLQTMWSLCAAGEGWSLGFGGQRKDPPPGLVAVTIKGFSLPWGVVLLTRHGESRPTALAVIDLLTHAAVKHPHR